jgi:hypothetical protein
MIFSENRYALFRIMLLGRMRNRSRGGALRELTAMGRHGASLVAGGILQRGSGPQGS